MAIKNSEKNKNDVSINAGGEETPPALKALFVIVNRDKAELFMQFLQDFEINGAMSFYAKGTSSAPMDSRSEKGGQLVGKMGNINVATPKSVLIAAVREDMTESVLDYLKLKFDTVKGGKGIAFTVPISSLIGVWTYKFLSNMIE